MNVIDVLNRIEDNGFEAYIVGGYVRDLLLGIESNDIDVCTNARVKDLLKIFGRMVISSNEYGAVKLSSDNFRFEITTYRRDLKYNGNRRALEVEYVDNLIDDINRRDFTMNTLCMSKDGRIIDLLNGKEDINNRIVRCVGKVNERLEEDPLRMLRAVRFASTLGFRIDKDLYKGLKNNKELLTQLSSDRIKEELTKILSNKNALVGLQMLKELGFLEYIGIDYNPDRIVRVEDICGMYSQLKISKPLPFSKEEKASIKAIQSILDYGIIDTNVIFNYGLYIAMVAGNIMGIDKEYIVDLDKEVPIHSMKEIKVNGEDICNILEIEPGKVISEVLDEIKDAILKGVIDNDYDIIKDYLVVNKRKWLNEGADVKSIKR